MKRVLIEHYKQQYEAGHIQVDAAQSQVLESLQSVFNALMEEKRQRARVWMHLRKPRLVNGLYLWGGVGIGKTYLMDTFYSCLPFQEKMRMHFHQFMHAIHAKLKLYQGKKNPLKIIAKEISQKAIVLCFDEFVVNDIADAMILANLLKELFACGVCLVTTSNMPPDDLYKRGLQRQLFLPAIALIKQHTDIIHLATTTDYRAQYLQSAGVFYAPNDQLANQKMLDTFGILTQELDVSTDPVVICGRLVKVERRAGNIVWFDFNTLCHVPRSQRDYLAIADDYHTVFLSNVPIIQSGAKNQITLFIKLIDVFYDAHVRLIMSSEVDVRNIYPEGSYLFEYQRTCSRLLEMQSIEYYAI